MARTPYTYVIGWKALDRWYYGVRFADNCDPSDLWNPYKTSSKYVLKFIAEHGDPDLKEVRKIFSTVDSARQWEHRVLRKLRVIHNNKWLNQTDNISISHEAGMRGAMKPKPAGFGEKIRRSRLGKHWSEEIKKKISESNLGKRAYFIAHTPESKKLLSDIGKTKIGPLNSFYGRKHTEATKQLIREKCALTKLRKREAQMTAVV